MRKLVMLAAALCIAAVPALAAVSFDNVMPERTLGMIRAKNIPALQAKAKAQPVWALWNEPSVQRFLERPLARLNEELAKAEGKAGVTLSDVTGLLRGEVALYVTTDAAAENPEIILLVDVGDQGARAMEIIGLMVTAAAKANDAAPAIVQVEQEIEGAKFMTVREAAADAAAQPKFCYGVVGDVLVVGGPLAAVQRQVGFLKAPPAKSLAANAAYVAAMAKMPAGSDIQAFVNITEILTVVQMKSGDPAKAAQWISALGLNGLTSGALGMELGKEYNTSCLFLGSQGTRQGIAKILMPQPGPLHTGAEVPADVAVFLSFRMDPASIYDDIEQMLGNVAPMVIAGLNEKINQAAQASGQQFNLRNDALALFGPRMGYYSRAEKPYNVPENQQQVFMIDIAGKAAFQTMLEKVQKLVPEFAVMFQPHEYMGYQMYVMETPIMGGGMAAVPDSPRPAFVATEKALLISANSLNLEAHLRRMNAGGPTLQAKPEFQELFKLLPAEGRVFFSFEDARPQVETIITALKSGQFDLLLAALRQDPDKAEVLDLFDLSLLPEPEVVSKYINPAASVGVVQPDGLFLISKSPSIIIPAPAK